MAHTVIIHVSNEEPVVGELEQLPAANDTVITVSFAAGSCSNSPTIGSSLDMWMMTV